MRGVLLWILLGTTCLGVTAVPCCPDDRLMYYANGTVICDGLNVIISAYNWCSGFYVQELDGKEFIENEDKTRFRSENSDKWETGYCTGTFENITEKENPRLVNFSGRAIAIVCLNDEDQPGDDHYALYATCLIISCVFLFATLVIYILLPELRDLQGKCVLCFILSLMIGYLCLVYLQLPLTSPKIFNNECVIIAFLTYFWMMSAFFWLNVNSFNMWRSAVLAHINVSERKLMQIYYLIGWGMPVCFLVIALITHHLPLENIIKPNFGVNSCWFQEKLELWSYFYGPVLILLVLNIVYFISTAFYLWSDYRSPDPMPRIRALRIKFGLYLKLFLVMGITWIFEILSSIDDEPWYVTDILNCFQGVIIFIVMVVLRKRVWRGLAAKKLCGVQFANCWERMDDEETANELVDEQQLSTNNVYDNVYKQQQDVSGDATK